MSAMIGRSRLQILSLAVIFSLSGLSCREKSGGADQAGYVDLASVEFVDFDPSRDPPEVTYRVLNRKQELAYLKVDITVTVDGTDYRLTHEPLGSAKTPAASIIPGARQDFTASGDALPRGLGNGPFAYQATCRIVDCQPKKSP
jgi:hypothetical protein